MKNIINDTVWIMKIYTFLEFLDVYLKEGNVIDILFSIIFISQQKSLQKIQLFEYILIWFNFMRVIYMLL